MTQANLERIVQAILARSGFNPVQPPEGEGDLLAEKNGNTYCLEVRASRTPVCPGDGLVIAGHRVAERSKKRGWLPVLVAGGTVSDQVRAELEGLSLRLTVIDLANLMYMAQPDPELADGLLGALPYVPEPVTPRRPEFAPGLAADMPRRRPRGTGQPKDWAPGGTEPPVSAVTGNIQSGKSSFLLGQLLQDLEKEAQLRAALSAWEGGKGSGSADYEKLCTRVLKRLFAQDLTLWQEQAPSDAGLFRFDLICKIKRDNRKDFWEMAERHFGSKYIIFEFKNYSGKVTQKEVFTTVRYLYTKALRGVAILISPNGIDEHADKAIRGVLRDEGKLVLTLTNRELIRMLRMKEDGEDPADFLSDKLDALLIDLEK